jgi:hypothetical protein
MSVQIAVSIALLSCVVHLLRYSARARLYRRTGEAAPAEFSQKVVALSMAASFLGVLLAGRGGPVMIGGVVAAFCLLGFQIIRDARPKQ